MKRALSVLAVLLLLFVVVLSVPLSSSELPLEGTVSVKAPDVRPTTAAYTPHAPIVITANEDFRNQGWPGEGDEKNPFVIEGLNITTAGTCINVTGTNVFFVVRDCLLSSSAFSSNAAVFFDRMKYGSVMDCVFYNHFCALYGIHVSYCAAYGNTVTGCARFLEMYYSDGCTFVGNAVTGGGHGFMVVGSASCMFVNNSVLDPDGNGYTIAMSYGCTFTNNTVVRSSPSQWYSNGFEVSESERCTFINNTALGAFIDFRVIFCTLCVFTGNTGISGSGITGYGYGFYIDSSRDCTLSYNVARDNDRHGFLIWQSKRITLQNNNATENSWAGFCLDSAVSCTLSKNYAYDNSGPPSIFGGFHLRDSYNCTVEDNHATQNYPDSFYLNRSDTCVLAGNVAESTNSNGFRLSYSHACILTNNVATNAQAGFLLDHSTHCTLVSNDAVSGTESGFALTYSHDCTLVGNTAADNEVCGIGLSYSSDCTVRENIAVGNDCGIGVDYSSDIVLFLNWIGPNNLNAGDAYVLGQNTWDDGVSQGNHWSDYSGSGVYPISGPSGSVDRFAFGMEPHIDHPEDVVNVEGTTGHSVVWHPSSLHPSFYELYIDTGTGLLYTTGSWDGSPFSASIDGLGLGFYSYRLVVYDTAGNSTSDTVFVTVVDNHPPTVSAPADLVYESGTTGHLIVWGLAEAHPASYTVLQDGDVIASGAWDGSSISISVDVLALGAYNYTLVVYDTSGNSACDTVFITVVDNTAPTIDRPADLSYEHGTTGHSLVWIPLDANPASYTILKDGDVAASGDWNGSEISIPVDGLDIGSHNYTIVVYDTSGHSVSDQVMVVVSPPDTTTTTTTTKTTTTTTTTSTTTTSGTTSDVLGGENPFLFMLLGAGFGAALVLGIVVFLRRR